MNVNMPETPESGDGGAGHLHATPPGSLEHAAPHHNSSGGPRDDPSVLKVTRGHSCQLCQQRKVRCDKSKPCSNCVRAGVECRVVPPQPPRRRKKRIPERDLVDRLRKYEALLAQNGIEFESLGPDVKVTDQGTVEEGDELDTDFIRPRARESPAGGPDPDEVISSPGETPHVPKWFPFQKEYRATSELVRDSSDEEDVGSSINQAYDKMFDNSGGFPFVVGGEVQSVTDQHPPAIQIFQLWQMYLDNANPLFKLTHTPTLQVRIIEASAAIDKVSRSLEALMFAIYLIAVNSITEEEALATFNEEKLALIAKYHHATQQALINADFMRTPDLTLLQAYLLYCIGSRQWVDPRTMFCLTGIGVRLAHRLGLHRDGAQFGLSPFEVEERRRLWWNLAGFDRRIGEMTGSVITAISNGGDCKLPLNINDADLNLHAKDPPTPHVGATEMMFALTRLEFSRGPGNDKMKSPLTDNPTAVANLADTRLATFLERFNAHMEDTYLRFCDPKIPLHYITILLTRAHMCKLKIMSGFFRAAVSSGSATHASVPVRLPTAESDAIFVEAIKMIEYDGMIFANESLKGFRWYMMMQFPFPAYVCLLSGLRERTTGELCERAWDAICEHHERRKLLSHLRTPLHIAFAPLFVKAWDARDAAEAQLGRTIAPPKLITLLRQMIARAPKRTKKKSPVPDHLAAQATTVPVGTDSYAPTVTAGPALIPSSHPQAQQPSPEVPPPAIASLYPQGQDLFGGAGGMPRQFTAAPSFSELNFGGEMDWNYLLQEYSGFMSPPPQEFYLASQHQHQHQQHQGVSTAAAANTSAAAVAQDLGHHLSNHPHQHQSALW
ncbi:hypothetical protein DL769_006237 [Monosporascus sp. CRB-8-3]|nr:hypothetical protein DL769_006237 [Monosporascus sp. CRB-8-3]